MQNWTRTRRRPSPLLALMFGWTMWLAAACDGSAAAPEDTARPNVLFVVIETLRKDHLEFYGYDKPTTPNLTALAESMVVFDNAVVQGNWTVPSVATILTSMYPASHKFIISHDKGTVLNPKVQTLAEVMKANGYRTGAYQTNGFLTTESGIAQGFDDYLFGDTVAADHLVQGALRWLNANRDAPFFLYLHLMDPHSPYSPPGQRYDRFLDDAEDLRPADFFKEAYEHLFLYENGELIRDLNHYRAAYDTSIYFMDYEIRKLFQYLDSHGLTEETLMVFVADHGEEFGDHGGMDHGYSLYEYMINVPMFMRFPGGRGARVATRVGAIDLAPTVLDYAGIEPPDVWQGRSFMDVVRNPGAEHKPLEFSQGNAISNVKERRFGLDLEQICVYEGRYKLIRSTPSGNLELYDLVEDPRERHNLAASEPRVVEKLSADLDAFLMYAERTSVDPEGEIQLDEEELEKLRSLGYVGGRKSK